MYTKCLSENLKRRDDSEDLGIDEKIILEWALENRVRSCGLDETGSRQGSVVGCCEHGK
jgi:hypothetical protein